MSLQRKFALLFLGLALLGLVNAAATLWSVEYARQSAAPWASIQGSLRALTDIKSAAAAALDALAPADVPSGPLVARINEQDARISSALARLNALDEFRVRIGASTSANLGLRIVHATSATHQWLAGPTADHHEHAAAELTALRDLAEAIERQIIGTADLQLDLGRAVYPRILIVLGSSILGLALLATLGVVLVRRWVVQPVRALRLAADRLAQGDFSYRVPPLGGDELGLLGAEINHMAATIAALQDERIQRERLAAVGEMVRRLAHNLRNPLAGIRSLAELTRAELPAPTPARENQDRIVATVDRFEGWLKDLLAATTPLHISPHPTRLRPWLQGLVEPLRPMAAAKAVDLSLDSGSSPQTVLIDPRHLEQALVAVLTNAIQASPRGQPVSIAAKALPDAKNWEIRIADRGPGVPPDLRDKVFLPYFTTKRDGTGIGLALAKQVVEQHGGRIWVEPRADGLGEVEFGENKALSGAGGAVFVLCLPRGTDADGSGQAKPGQDGASSGQGAGGRGRGEPPVLNPADAPAGRA